MKRISENFLYRWYNSPHRKPLVIRGARQVGKSTLVRQFAQKNQLTLNEINLERHLQLDAIFATLDVQRILREMEGLLGRFVDESNSVLFLDEIQATPHALQALRYLYEERPQLSVVAAGSLLEFALAEKTFSMPVGRIEYLHLGPMSFEEYLLEIDAPLLPYLTTCEPAAPIPTTVHTRLLQRQREYMLVGGMPEAVLVFSQRSAFTDVADVQRAIMDTYQDDFAKYGSRSALLRLQTLFNYVPRTVGQKMKYSNVSRDENARELRAAIEMLSKARVVSPVLHSHCSGLPLYADVVASTYKLLFLDVGLMNRACGLDWLAISSLDERSFVNEGAMAEQFIGQHLLYQDEGRESPRLCYWLREQKVKNAEVDYVISRGERIVPIEVKAGKSGSLRSLHQFVLHKHVNLAVRFDLNPISIQRVEHKLDASTSIAFDLLSAPLYMVGQLGRLIDLYRSGQLRSD
ncbi:MAG: ATP-binding protein [Candidatus Latescibacteria bacterium]|jgi:uncharacterized protein|nr:ATP-binding protein [Candidatus Latescibacterota bacterium]MBT4136801.1 ATP-binding protein [Candidatus Latescibacterota bacterium]MBT5830775.1 ATP-binding protein [Candidatus Latescibacterota bacterium]